LSGENSRLPAGADDAMLARRAAEYIIEGRMENVLVDGV
jgi:hypothetical protein